MESSNSHKEKSVPPLLLEIEQRWERQFQALARGCDVSPSQRLRLEGLMEAAVLCGIAQREHLQQAMSQSYYKVNGVTFVDEFGDDWQTFFEFPQIPAMMRRAPVVPTTSE